MGVSQPEQRQYALHCIDDEDDSSDETGVVVNLDDARDNLWTIQPKSHKRKSTKDASVQKENEPQEEGEGGNDDYEAMGKLVQVVFHIHDCPIKMITWFIKKLLISKIGQNCSRTILDIVLNSLEGKFEINFEESSWCLLNCSGP